MRIPPGRRPGPAESFAAGLAVQACAPTRAASSLSLDLDSFAAAPARPSGRAPARVSETLAMAKSITTTEGQIHDNLRQAFQVLYAVEDAVHTLLKVREPDELQDAINNVVLIYCAKEIARSLAR